MKVSYLWLKEFVDLEVEPRQLADDLSMVGIVVETVEAAGRDFILDLDLTTNRADCLSHFGVAREIAARYRKSLKCPKPVVEEASVTAASEISVSIDSPQLCSRYCARVIRGAKVAPSPPWLVSRLESLGIRAINNIVDVTNYVLLELGHPLHAFDLSKIQGQKIIVRQARAGERLLTLDGLNRDLRPGMLLIADRDLPLALAGVMGGADSEIGFSSRDVLLESAWFEPNSVRKTSKELGMHTEASHRFERGADIAATVPSINRTATLIQEVAGGEILRGVVDAFPKPYRRPAVALRRARILQVMGTEIEDSFTESILTDLNFEIVSRDQTGWQVQLPTSRLDVEREIDLIEEIARHYGYNRFASRLPAWCGGATRRPQAIQERTVKQRLLSLGYSETLTYSFVDASENQRFSTLEPIRLRNPLSTETEVMRTSLVPGLLSSFLRNYNRGTKTVRIFEMGRIYPSSGLAAGDDRMSPAPTDDQLENLFLGMILSGQAQEKTVHADSRPVNFFDLKGDLEALLESLSLPLHGVAWQPATSGRLPGYFHPAVCASMHLEEKLLGVFGQLHPRICESYKIKQPVFLAEIPLACWYLHEVKERAVEDLAKYPAVERDLSIVVDSSVDYHSILLAVQEAGILEVRECFPFDLYCGGKLPAGKKSISISLVYQALDRTLVEEEVNDYHGRILDLLQKKLGAQLRA